MQLNQEAARELVIFAGMDRQECIIHPMTKLHWKDWRAKFLMQRVVPITFGAYLTIRCKALAIKNALALVMQIGL